MPEFLLAGDIGDGSTSALKVPPHSIEAEQSVIGGLMLDNSAWDQIADRVSEPDFYRKEHRRIFGAIRALAERNEPFDVVTLSERLASLGELDAVGGIAHLGELARNTPSAANIVAYASIVRERSVLRQLIQIGGDIANSAYQTEGRSGVELLDNAERLVFEIAEQGGRRMQGFLPIKELLASVVDRIDDLYKRDSPITGVATGFSDLDERTSGLQPGDLIIVAGRPSMGKTSFAMNVVEYAAISGGLPVAVFSMEMPAEQLTMRMLSSLSRIDQHKVRTGRLGDDDWPRLTSALNMLGDTKIFVDDTAALTPTELRARCRRLKREHGLGLVVVDYLQLMQVPGTKENRATEISEISRSLKALAKDLKLPIVALSQLNRSLEQRPDKRPQMSDLRECVSGDTLVVLADGARTPIRELVGRRPRVVGMGADQRMVRATAEIVWEIGERETFELSLASGRRLRATLGHRLWTARGWERLERIGVGSTIAIARDWPDPRGWECRPDQSPLQANLRSESPMSRGTFPQSAASCDVSGPAGSLGSDLAWDRVVAMRAIGREAVFDLTVPGPGSWLADGIVSHNSGAIEQDADVILFIYRDEVYHDDSPDKGIAEINIGKQRNGPIGRVKLTFLNHITKFENFAPEDFTGAFYS